MTTREFLVSSWPVHPASVAGVVILSTLFVIHWREAGAQAEAALKGGPEAKVPLRALFWSKSFVGLRPKGHTLYLFLSLAMLWLALDSPLDLLAARYLFSAHMLQHLILVLVIPPLLLLAWATTPVNSAGQKPQGAWQRRRVPVLTGSYRPWLTWLAGVGAMWFWHVPALCNAAASHPAVRTLQAVSLLLLGSLFWLPILGPRVETRISPLAGVLYLFTACMGCTLLGIYITFTPVSVCPVYMHPADARGVLDLIRNQWGLKPSVDQQLGGLLMWVPACLIYLCGMLGLLGRWYAGAPLQAKPPEAHSEPKMA